MSTFIRFGKAVRVVAAALGALTMAAAAEAVDVRSWDQVITDPGKRFVVLSAFGNQAVLDKETQLVWTRHINPQVVYNWPGIRITCANLGQTFGGGRYGWRMPTIHELASLFPLPPGHPFQIPVPPALLISATTDSYDPAMAWVLEPTGGVNGTPELRLGPKGNSFANIFCVRGPGGDGASY